MSEDKAPSTLESSQPPLSSVPPSSTPTPPKKIISFRAVKAASTSPFSLPPLEDKHSRRPPKQQREEKSNSNVKILPERESNLQDTFPISVSSKLTTQAIREVIGVFDSHADLQPIKVVDEDRMANAGWVTSESVRSLWAQKNRMDDLFDSGNGKLYYSVREQVCPFDAKGSAVFWNRAGDKLSEVYSSVPFFLEDDDGPSSTNPPPPPSADSTTDSAKEAKERTPVAFFDICGGPGAWSQFLLGKLPRDAHGYGITLRVEDTPSSDAWYSQLERDPRFEALYGTDGTGNVYKMDNLDSVCATVAGKNIKLAVADGGFKIQKDSDGTHMENLQELFSGRIVLSEAYLALRTLTPGGSFVCKLFDTFSSFTVSLIFLMCSFYEKVAIVKPPHSRRVNSERYLVCNKRLDDDDLISAGLALLELFHARGFGDDKAENIREFVSPRSLVPIDLMTQDASFKSTISEMCLTLAERQTEALSVVMNEVDNIQKEGNSYRYTNSSVTASGSRHNREAERYSEINDDRDFKRSRHNRDRDYRGRDNRDYRDRNNRDNRYSRDSRDSRDSRTRDNRDNRNNRDYSDRYDGGNSDDRDDKYRSHDNHDQDRGDNKEERHERKKRSRESRDDEEEGGLDEFGRERRPKKDSTKEAETGADSNLQVEQK